jgi:hypothetical protein
MSRRTRRVVVVLSLGLLTFPAADLVAQTDEPKKPLSVSVLVGGDAVVAGEFNREEDTSGLFGTIRLPAHSHDQVYRRAFSVGAEIAYTYRPGAEVLTRATFTAAGSRGPVPWTESTERSPPSTTTRFASVSDCGVDRARVAACYLTAAGARAPTSCGRAIMSRPVRLTMPTSP